MPAIPTPEAAPALKEIFNPARLEHIADETSAVCPGFDRTRFLSAVLAGLDELSIMQRLRRVAEGLHAAVPGDYLQVLDVLRVLVPRINSGFVTMALPEYVALYGSAPQHVEASLDALKFFTRFGSSEFAIRHFLKADQTGTLRVMAHWSRDPNEHVRRLASEGSRPRLPWSFHLKPLMADPSPLAEILDNLQADPSAYVRRSVANSLNDITKDNPAWALDKIRGWDLEQPATAWIARHALRSLIKQGHREALGVVGAGGEAQVEVRHLRVSPSVLRLGAPIELSVELASTAPADQRLVVDYAIHYVKKNGSTAAKVFKLKTLHLPAGASVVLARKQLITDFTTRVHYPGRHAVELLVNGTSFGQGAFDLLP